MSRVIGVVIILLTSFSAHATITFDGTACSGGVWSNCPHGTATSGVAAAMTVTTSSFSTSKPELLIFVAKAKAVSSCTSMGFNSPTISGGGGTGASLRVQLPLDSNNVAVASIWYVFTATAITSQTASVTATCSLGQTYSAELEVFPVSSNAVIGRGVALNGLSALSVTQTGVLGGSLYLGAAVNWAWDGTAPLATSGIAGFIVNDTSIGANSFDLISSSPVSAGSTTISATDGAIISSETVMVGIEIIDATINVGIDPAACPSSITTMTSSGILTSCKVGAGTTGSTVTSAAFSTSSAIELICVAAGQVGVAATGIAISDNGITKSAGWTAIKECHNSTTNWIGVYCAITSAQVPSKTVTATLTRTSSTLSYVAVFPFLYANTTALPLSTNAVCATGTSGAATLTLTAASVGSLVLESGVNTTTTTAPTATTTPQAWITDRQTATAQEIWIGDAWTTATGSNTVGTSAPTSTLWALTGIEILPTSAATSSSPGWVNWW